MFDALTQTGQTLSVKVATSPILNTSSGWDDGWYAPGLEEFFPEPFLFEGTPFAINRIMLVRFVAVAALVAVLWFGTRRLKMVPGRGQSLLELIFGFIRNNIAVEALGEKLGRKYTPLLATILLGVLFMNMTGVIPFLNIAGSSVIGIPIIFALISLIGFIYAGIAAQGGLKFFRNQLFPPGVPAVMYVILTPIELISTFILRPLTLTVRLLANMMSGHILMVLSFSATHYLFFYATASLKAAGAVTLLAGILFVIFEIFIAALQAYIFTLLTAVYIQLSVEDH